MPQTAPHPIGGAKTVYTYADALAARGHRVVVAHPRESLLAAVRYRLDVDPDRESRGGAPGDADLAAEWKRHESRGDPHPWYQSRPDVLNLVVPSLAEEHVGGPFDVTVVNNRRAVAWAQSYSPRMGRRIYFLQDYESYMLGDEAEREEARRTLRLDWPLVCTSLAGARLVESAAGKPCHLVRNAIDTRLFRPFIPVGGDERTLIGFPARAERTKRTYDAVRAAELARPHLPPSVGFWCFGHERIPGLPDWITHHVGPDDSRLAELYNRSRLFLVPSEHEGFGRPGAEAMACGAALISSRNGGVETYATDGETAVLCAPREPEQMAAAVRRLTDDEATRRRIAECGAESISRWSLDEAVDRFEKLLAAEAAKRPRP
ncbi:MAG TPA: glycosyltransferase family 4 protein [Pyrinomonadaceae bacterium]|nr:glycosyltransferase family 4 protein [Pyrinomonadaceae bacterium]